MTGLVDIVGYLTTYWDKDNSARKQKCKAFYFLSYKPKVKLNNPSHPIGIELLAQAVTPSQSSLDSFTSTCYLTFYYLQLTNFHLLSRRYCTVHRRAVRRPCTSASLYRYL